MHMIFSYNIDKGKFGKLQVLIPTYYEICLKCKLVENQLTYYMDIARYLYSSSEYVQASGYYNTIRIEAEKLKKNEVVAKATFNECACYIMLEKYEEAYKIAESLKSLVDYFNDNTKKAEAYHMMAVLSLRMNKECFKEYEQKSYELYGENKIYKANAIYNYAVTMMDLGLRDEGIQYIMKALDCHPKEKEENLVSFMVMCINELIKNDIIDEAEKISNETINYAIDLNNIKYIEKAYHCKALILGKKHELEAEEMYMNLSLDTLMKFGNKKEVYERYLEMGNMYHKMNNVGEAIKYFNLAINLSKKI
ncbi:tetratricopeptide repeat protein [Clostridium tetanomorphum]|nr:tetratricopeptide repeat protein [Clostridium tetanomorphum]